MKQRLKTLLKFVSNSAKIAAEKFCINPVNTDITEIMWKYIHLFRVSY